MAKAVSPTERRLLGVFAQSMHGSVARSLSEKLVFWSLTVTFANPSLLADGLASITDGNVVRFTLEITRNNLERISK